MESETKHTASPWIITEDRKIASKSSRGDWFIAYLQGHAMIAPSEEKYKAWKTEDEANACLIAAAPDLLEASKQAESLMGSGFIMVETDAQSRQINYTMITLRAAIAKAEAQEIK